MKTGYSVIPCEWRDELEGRERRQVAHAENYKYNFQAAQVPGHSHLMLIARLARILDGCVDKPPMGRAEAVRKILLAVCPVLGIQIEKMRVDAGQCDLPSADWRYYWDVSVYIEGHNRTSRGTVDIKGLDSHPATRVARFILDRLGP